MPEREITAPTVRLGGAAAVVGGILSLSPYLVTFSLLAAGVAPESTYWSSYLVGTVAAFLVATGLVGVYGLLGRRSGLGIAGVALVCLSSLVWALPLIYAGASPGLVVAGAVFLGSKALEVVGVLLIGVAAAGTGVLGRWAFVPFVISALAFLSAVLWAFDPLGTGTPARPLDPVEGISWILLGVALWRRSSRTREDQSGPA